MSQTNNKKDDLDYNDLNEIIEDSKSELSEYLKKRVKLFKLGVYDKSAIIGAYVTYGLAILLMVYFIAFLFLLSAGFWLGEMLGSMAAGFGILVFLCLIGFFIFLRNGKSFRRYISNLVVSLIKKIESDDE